MKLSGKLGTLLGMIVATVVVIVGCIVIIALGVYVVRAMLG